MGGINSYLFQPQGTSEIEQTVPHTRNKEPADKQSNLKSILKGRNGASVASAGSVHCMESQLNIAQVTRETKSSRPAMMGALDSKSVQSKAPSETGQTISHIRNKEAAEFDMVGNSLIVKRELSEKQDKSSSVSKVRNEATVDFIDCQPCIESKTNIKSVALESRYITEVKKLQTSYIGTNKANSEMEQAVSHIRNIEFAEKQGKLRSVSKVRNEAIVAFGGGVPVIHEGKSSRPDMMGEMNSESLQSKTTSETKQAELHVRNKESEDFDSIKSAVAAKKELTEKQNRLSSGFKMRNETTVASIDCQPCIESKTNTKLLALESRYDTEKKNFQTDEVGRTTETTSKIEKSDPHTRKKESADKQNLKSVLKVRNDAVVAFGDGVLCMETQMNRSPATYERKNSQTTMMDGINSQSFQQKTTSEVSQTSNLGSVLKGRHEASVASAGSVHCMKNQLNISSVTHETKSSRPAMMGALDSKPVQSKAPSEIEQTISHIRNKEAAEFDMVGNALIVKRELSEKQDKSSSVSKVRNEATVDCIDCQPCIESKTNTKSVALESRYITEGKKLQTAYIGTNKANSKMEQAVSHIRNIEFAEKQGKLRSVSKVRNEVIVAFGGGVPVIHEGTSSRPDMMGEMNSESLQSKTTSETKQAELHVRNKESENFDSIKSAVAAKKGLTEKQNKLSSGFKMRNETTVASIDCQPCIESKTNTKLLALEGRYDTEKKNFQTDEVGRTTGTTSKIEKNDPHTRKKESVDKQNFESVLKVRNDAIVAFGDGVLCMETQMNRSPATYERKHSQTTMMDGINSQSFQQKTTSEVSQTSNLGSVLKGRHEASVASAGSVHCMKNQLNIPSVTHETKSSRPAMMGALDSKPVQSKAPSEIEQTISHIRNKETAEFDMVGNALIVKRELSEKQDKSSSVSKVRNEATVDCIDCQPCIESKTNTKSVALESRYITEGKKLQTAYIGTNKANSKMEQAVSHIRNIEFAEKQGKLRSVSKVRNEAIVAFGGGVPVIHEGTSSRPDMMGEMNSESLQSKTTSETKQAELHVRNKESENFDSIKSAVAAKKELTEKQNKLSSGFKMRNETTVASIDCQPCIESKTNTKLLALEGRYDTEKKNFQTDEVGRTTGTTSKIEKNDPHTRKKESVDKQNFESVLKVRNDAIVAFGDGVLCMETQMNRSPATYERKHSQTTMMDGINSQSFQQKTTSEVSQTSNLGSVLKGRHEASVASVGSVHCMKNQLNISSVTHETKRSRPAMMGALDSKSVQSKAPSEIEQTISHIRNKEAAEFDMVGNALIVKRELSEKQDKSSSVSKVRNEATVDFIDCQPCTGSKTNTKSVTLESRYNTKRKKLQTTDIGTNKTNSKIEQTVPHIGNIEFVDKQGKLRSVSKVRNEAIVAFGGGVPVIHEGTSSRPDMMGEMNSKSLQSKTTSETKQAELHVRNKESKDFDSIKSVVAAKKELTEKQNRLSSGFKMRNETTVASIDCQPCIESKTNSKLLALESRYDTEKKNFQTDEVGRTTETTSKIEKSDPHTRKKESADKQNLKSVLKVRNDAVVAFGDGVLCMETQMNRSPATYERKHSQTTMMDGINRQSFQQKTTSEVSQTIWHKRNKESANSDTVERTTPIRRELPEKQNKLRSLPQIRTETTVGSFDCQPCIENKANIKSVAPESRFDTERKKLQTVDMRGASESLFQTKTTSKVEGTTSHTRTNVSVDFNTVESQLAPEKQGNLNSALKSRNEEIIASDKCLLCVGNKKKTTFVKPESDFDTEKRSLQNGKIEITSRSKSISKIDETVPHIRNKDSADLSMRASHLAVLEKNLGKQIDLKSTLKQRIEVSSSQIKTNAKAVAVESEFDAGRKKAQVYKEGDETFEDVVRLLKDQLSGTCSIGKKNPMNDQKCIGLQKIKDKDTGEKKLNAKTLSAGLDEKEIGHGDNEYRKCDFQEVIIHEIPTKQSKCLPQNIENKVSIPVSQASSTAAAFCSDFESDKATQKSSSAVKLSTASSCNDFKPDKATQKEKLCISNLKANAYYKEIYNDNTSNENSAERIEHNSVTYSDAKANCENEEASIEKRKAGMGLVFGPSICDPYRQFKEIGEDSAKRAKFNNFNAYPTIQVQNSNKAMFVDDQLKPTNENAKGKKIQDEHLSGGLQGDRKTSSEDLTIFSKFPITPNLYVSEDRTNKVVRRRSDKNVQISKDYHEESTKDMENINAFSTLNTNHGNPLSCFSDDKLEKSGQRSLPFGNKKHDPTIEINSFKDTKVKQVKTANIMQGVDNPPYINASGDTDITKIDLKENRQDLKSPVCVPKQRASVKEKEIKIKSQVYTNSIIKDAGEFSTDCYNSDNETNVVGDLFIPATEMESRFRIRMNQSIAKDGTDNDIWIRMGDGDKTDVAQCYTIADENEHNSSSEIQKQRYDENCFKFVINRKVLSAHSDLLKTEELTAISKSNYYERVEKKPSTDAKIEQNTSGDTRQDNECCSQMKAIGSKKGIDLQLKELTTTKVEGNGINSNSRFTSFKNADNSDANGSISVVKVFQSESNKLKDYENRSCRSLNDAELMIVADQNAGKISPSTVQATPIPERKTLIVDNKLQGFELQEEEGVLQKQTDSYGSIKQRESLSSQIDGQTIINDSSLPFSRLKIQDGFRSNKVTNETGNGKAQTVNAKARKTVICIHFSDCPLSKDDVAEYISQRMGADKKITFEINEFSKNIRSCKRNAKTKVTVSFPSARAASKAVHLLHKSNRGVSNKIFCSYPCNNESGNNKDMEKERLDKAEFDKSAWQMTETAKQAIDKHKRKIQASINSLEETERKLNARKGVSLEIFNILSQEKQARKEKVIELKSQLQEFKGYLSHMNETLNIMEPASKSKLNEVRKSLGIECRKLEAALPMYARRDDILKTIRSSNVSVILGETGSGKSTQLVQYLFSAGFAEKGIIVCTQPRKIAAINLAKRVASEMASNVGLIVGYQVGMQTHQTTETKILYMTDHVLLNECLKDETLSLFSCIIIDEAHERSIYTDLLIGMIKNCLLRRPELKVIITSATINPDVFVSYFGGVERCPVLKVSGRTFPVEVVWYDEMYDDPFPEEYERKAVDRAIDVHTSEPTTTGDILVFMTSPAEAERCCLDFSTKVRHRNFLCLPLHGKLKSEDQQLVFEPSPKGVRKIVFATNSAETSVTIPGVKYVIDTGVVKEMRYEPKKKMNCLSIVPVSQSSANQRKGRAGRTGPGICYRLYSHNDFSQMETAGASEILRINLGQALLKLLQLNVDPLAFDFVESPSRVTMIDVMNTLRRLGAIERNTLTDLGMWIANLPLEPRLGVLVKNGLELGVVIESIIVATSSSAGSVFYRGGSLEEKKKADLKKIKFCHPGGDFLTILNVYRAWNAVNEKAKGRWCITNCINGKTMKAIRESVKEIIDILKKEMKMDVKYELCPEEDSNAKIQKLVMESLLPNVCFFLGHERAGYITIDSLQHVQIHPSSSLISMGQQPKWIVYEQILKTSDDYVTNISPAAHEDLERFVSQGLIALETNDLENRVVSCVCKIPVGKYVFWKFVGPLHTGRKELEETIKRACANTVVVIEADKQKGEVLLYAVNRYEERAGMMLKEVLNDIPEALKYEAREVPLDNNKGEVRAVIGHGGCVMDILMAHKYRSMNIKLKRFLSVEPSERELEKMFSCFGPIDQIWQAKGKKKTDFWGKVTFLREKDASAAADEINSDENGLIEVIPIRCSSSSNCTREFTVQLSWCRRLGKGIAYVYLEYPEDEVPLFMKSPFRIGGKRVEIQHAKKRSNYMIRGLSAYVSEDQIKEALSAAVGVTPSPHSNRFRVIIPRQPVTYSVRQMEAVRRQLETAITSLPLKGNYRIHIKDVQDQTARFTAFVNFTDPDDCDILMEECADGIISMNNSPVEASMNLKSSLVVQRNVFQVVKSDVDEYIQKIRRKSSSTNIKRREIKSGNMVIDINSTSQHKLAKTLKSVHKIVDGEQLECERVHNLHLLFTKSSRQEVANIQRYTKSYIVLDERTYKVSVYGSPDSRKTAVEEIKLYLNYCKDTEELEITLKGQGNPPGFMRELIIQYDTGLQGLKRATDLAVISLNYKLHKVSMIGSNKAITKACELIWSVKEKLSQNEISKLSDISDCPICICPVELSKIYRLEYCGHAYCKDCLRDQMLNALNDKKFPIECAVDGCGKDVMIRDINVQMKQGAFTSKRLVAAAVACFVAKNSSSYRYCLTPNCEMIYKISPEGDLFICPLCSCRICTTCHVQYHDGVTCALYGRLNSKDDSVQTWVSAKPHKRKTCPKCGVGIEKTEGCNNVHCLACRAHICWVCLQFYKQSRECYAHLENQHGSFV